MSVKENKDFGIFLIRLSLALIFIIHGWVKLNSLGSSESFFVDVGIPAASTMVVIVALIEFLSGIAMLLGVLTSWAGGAIAVIMLVAILQVKVNKSFIGGSEFDLVLFLSALSVVLTGPGNWTIYKLFRK